MGLSMLSPLSPHCKKVNDFPVPIWDVTNQTLSRESLVKDIPAGDGRMANLFYSALSKLA